MALYRCAMCGSGRIELETKQEGYNKKKGIKGAILFGEIGALAGAGGNTVTYYHCGDCGAVLNHAMLSVEKASLERCLESPDIFESSLKSYKERYKNIEWEEGQIISEDISMSEEAKDIEDCIIQYMKKLGVPVPVSKLDNKFKKFAMEYVDSVDNLEKRGLLKYEIIGEGLCCILVTDVEEMKEVALERQAKDLVNGELALDLKKHDYISILKEFISLHDSVTEKEIYDYLEQNKYLSEKIIKAEKKNKFIYEYIMKKIYMNDRWYREFICENGKYRMKTAEEKDEAKNEENMRIQRKVDSIKPVIAALQRSKKAIKTYELCELINGHFGYEYITSSIRLSGCLGRLEEIGIVIRKVEKKDTLFTISDMTQEEIDKKLWEAVSDRKISGFVRR